MSPTPPTLRQTVLGAVAFAVIGMCAMAYLQAFEFTTNSKYHRDLTQSPHWAAYHGDAFPADDLLVRYASYNESPLQNAVYWVGTWFVDLVPLAKLVGVGIFGMTAALFFALMARMAGLQAGILAASFFVIFPRGAYEIAGGYSKAWAIGLVMLSVYVVETRSWRILPWAMPLAALAYPVSPVLMGAIVAVGVLLEALRSRADAFRGLRFLAVGSVLALVPLLYKYFTPPSFIGDMVPRSRMEELWDLGFSSERPIPLWEEIYAYLEHPFFVIGVPAILMIATGRGLVWRRSWTALAVASAGSYLVALAVVPRLYLPDRYTRYSMAVLLVLWFAENCGVALSRLSRPAARRLAAAALIGVAMLSFPETFRPCDGDKSQGIWEDRGKLAEISAAVAELDTPVLIAGHPNTTAGVMVQARRPVLLINRMFHHWFDRYRASIDERNRDLIRAVYAEDTVAINALAEKYGVTHLIVEPWMFGSRTLRRGSFYRKEYQEFVWELTEDRAAFFLEAPPLDHVVYSNRRFRLIRLPIASWDDG